MGRQRLCLPLEPRRRQVAIRLCYRVRHLKTINGTLTQTGHCRDPTGYSWHADFQNGWDVNVLQNAIDQCDNPNDQTGNGGTTEI